MRPLDLGFPGLRAGVDPGAWLPALSRPPWLGSPMCPWPTVLWPRARPPPLDSPCLCERPASRGAQAGGLVPRGRWPDSTASAAEGGPGEPMAYREGDASGLGVLGPHHGSPQSCHQTQAVSVLCPETTLTAHLGLRAALLGTHQLPVCPCQPPPLPGPPAAHTPFQTSGLCLLGFKPGRALLGPCPPARPPWPPFSLQPPPLVLP